MLLCLFKCIRLLINRFLSFICLSLCFINILQSYSIWSIFFINISRFLLWSFLFLNLFILICSIFSNTILIHRDSLS
nr:MAG TPA_asm: hypothetical protein [Bacteriophage sp.]